MEQIIVIVTTRGVSCFSSNKKNHELHMKGYFIAKNSFEMEVTFKKIISECFEYSKKKIHYGERLKQVAPTTLLKYFPIMGNFLEMFQEFIKHNFTSDGNTSVVGVIFSSI